MRISELAAATNEPAGTLRFYEAEGVLSPPKRTASGYRDYGPSAVDQVRSVRALQLASLSLADIATLIRVRDTQGPISSDDATVVASARRSVDHQLARLSRGRTVLGALLHQSATEDAADSDAPRDCTSSSPLQKPEDD